MYVSLRLNSSKGIIRCRELFDLSEVEIRDELKAQGVVEVHRVTVKKEGKVIPTNTLFLTFNRPDMPKELRVGYLKVKVDLFIPNPLPPQWGAADAEIKVPFGENTELKRSPFKAWSRSVYKP